MENPVDLKLMPLVYHKERLILDYEPTMLLIEHDVKFREKIATKILHM